MAVKRLAERDDEVASGALAFTVDRPISMETLAEELAGGSSSRPGLVVEGDPAKASADYPCVVWAMGGVETNDFKRAVKEHQVDAPRTAPARPDFLDKPEDEPFTEDEMQQALRWLLKRAGA